MKNKLKILSLIYLFFLTIAFLIPLDFLILDDSKVINNQPSNEQSFFIHYILFFLLYLLFNFSFDKKMKVFFYCLIYSIFIETMQIFTSRGFQFVDIIFNLLGVATSFWICLYLEKFKILNVKNK